MGGKLKMGRRELWNWDLEVALPTRPSKSEGKKKQGGVAGKSGSPSREG